VHRSSRAGQERVRVNLAPPGNPVRPDSRAHPANPISLAHRDSPVRLDNRARPANLVSLAHRVNLISLAHRVRAGRPVNRAIQGSPEAPARVEIQARTAKARAPLVAAADRQDPRRRVS
jgi:hypothetical protein